jgi:hypothetical protein
MTGKPFLFSHAVKLCAWRFVVFRLRHRLIISFFPPFFDQAGSQTPVSTLFLSKTPTDQIPNRKILHTHTKPKKKKE